jgi:iron(III) transport system substrate-binding protein
MPRRRLLVALVALVLAGVTAACNGGGGSGDGPLVVYSGRNENLVRPLLEQFARESGVDISVRYGDTSELAPTILEEGQNTRADVFFSQDAGALAALGDAGLFRKLPTSLLNKVDRRFRDPDGRWTGVTARARVIAYNTDKLKEQDLPPSALAVVEPAWKGRVGIAPTNASFVAYVSALIEEIGEPRTRQFLEGLEANGVKEYDNNILILDAIASGEIDAGLVNHYYLYGEFKERPDAPVANFYPGQGADGEGTFINVAGVGILENTDKVEQANQLVEFLLSKRGQEYFRDETTEYPLASGVAAIDELPPIASLKTIDVPLDRLGTDLSGSLELIKDVGLT